MEVDGSELSYDDHTAWFPVVKHEMDPEAGVMKQKFSG
jgi:hypothetical protein